MRYAGFRSLRWRSTQPLAPHHPWALFTTKQAPRGIIKVEPFILKADYMVCLSCAQTGQLFYADTEFLNSL
ncbi:MAG: hypothetical protein DRQ61_10195 [Gammaproteobacteria bacterium]|nr:MAG: hypothetical protein DRQ61_10195 [Gammaproteobacteria bacterium]